MTTQKTITVDLNDLISVLYTVINGVGSSGFSGATASNSAASAGTGRTTSNAEQDAKDAFKRSFVGDQVDSDIGGEEAHESLVHDQTSAWSANRKRTYDVYQSLDLEGVLGNRQKADVLFQLSTQALQNAVETANMVSKGAVRSQEQSIRHADIAIDRQWNIDEVSDLAAKTGVQQDALATVLAAAIAEALNKKGDFHS